MMDSLVIGFGIFLGSIFTGVLWLIIAVVLAAFGASIKVRGR